MAERQRKLHQKRKKRDPGKAFDIRPNPRHAATHPVSKGLRILSTLPQLSRTWLSGVNDGPSKYRQNSAICGIFATPHHLGGGEPPAPDQSRDRPDCRLAAMRKLMRACAQLAGRLSEL